MSTVGRGPVVVGVDGTSSNREAVVQAAWEAERRAVPLRLVHGYLVPTPCLTPLAPLLDESRLLAAARSRLAEIARAVRSRRPQLPLTTRAVRASGGAALLRESATASLVVIGAPRHGGFAGTPIGSVAAQVVADARGPVLVVPRSAVVPAPVPPTGPVLVGVDGSADSELALGFGFDEAAARGVALVAVHVWSVPELSGLSRVGGGARWDSDPNRAQLELQETAERILAEAMAGWPERYPQVPVRRWVVHAFGAARILLDVAQEVGTGLIVVGSRGRSGLAAMMPGSVGQVLISHSEATVAVVHPNCARVPAEGAEPVRSGQG